MINIRFLCAVICVFLLSACSNQPSENVAQTALAQTQVAQPTATATPVPVAPKDLDLNSLAFQSGDLPEEYSLSGEVDYSPAMLDDEIQKLLINAIQMKFLHNRNAGGSVMIAIFNSNFDRNKAYEYLETHGTLGTTTTDLTDIGESGYIRISPKTSNSPDSVDIVFVRCSTVVRIVIARDAKEADAINYSKTLDERLTPLVCP